MEDTARLAQIEMSVNNDTTFETLLKELLKFIKLILDNPHDVNIRKLKSDELQSLLKYEELGAYLKYIGFESHYGEFVFPQGQRLSKLKLAQAAIEKKIIYCYGEDQCPNSRKVRPPKKICPLKPVNVLTTRNRYLLNIQKLFNDILEYEDEDLQELARSYIPLTQLQVRACERMREHQKKIKTGAVVGEDMTFEMALLSELVSWFKHKFFSWVDTPPCNTCGGKTRIISKRTRVMHRETCLVEEYACTECTYGTATFPRHRSPRVLLRTRRGRCGEFANCFALLCRALGYDTRYVFDTTDHVWCEVYDYDSTSWVHVDPCEAVVGAPLLYTHGWSKQLAYVIAISRDDLQDVTWRYTSNHKEVMSRRDLCSESELLGAILQLRAERQAQVSAARRRFLLERALRELVQLQVERKPEDYESQGRVSGSLAWRQRRGEAGAAAGHVFQFDKPGTCVIQYYPAADEYKVRAEGEGSRKVNTWSTGVFSCERVFRMVEADWKMVYLAREEDADSGTISWKMSGTGKQWAFQGLTIKAQSTVFGTGKVQWTLAFDDEDPASVALGNNTVRVLRTFKSLVVTAKLSGGGGSVAWQHAQLFRQPQDSQSPALEIEAQLFRDDIDLD